MKTVIKLLLVTAALVISGQAKALFLITPSDCNEGVNCWTTADTTNYDANDVENFLSGEGVLLSGDLTEVYKSNVGGADEGSAAGSITTTYFNSPTEPRDALIDFDGISFDCPDCFLLIKDGNKEPAQYVFDLTVLGWDGAEDIKLENFWPGVEDDGSLTGAISHIALYTGEGGSVPEPGMLALVALGLIGFAGARRFKA